MHEVQLSGDKRRHKGWKGKVCVQATDDGGLNEGGNDRDGEAVKFKINFKGVEPTVLLLWDMK